jgi:chromosome segregation ATPase
MKSQTAMDELIQISGALAETEEEIGRLREEIKSFQDDGSDETFVPLLLDADWSFDKASAELNALLQKRHATTARHRELTQKLETTKQSERAKLKSDLTKRYASVVKAMLAAAISFSKAVEDAEKLRQEASGTFGGEIGFLTHVGPPRGNFDLQDTMRSSWPQHWIREAIEAGFIKRDDPLLDGIVF